MSGLINQKKLAIVVVATSATVSAYADLIGARNSGMGGTGVASSRFDTASIYNAALLTNKENRDSFSLILPSVGVLASDKDEVIDIIDDLTDEFDELELQIDSAQVAAATATKDRIIDDLRLISDKPVTLDAAVAPLVVALPGDKTGFALSVSGLSLIHISEPRDCQ